MRDQTHAEAKPARTRTGDEGHSSAEIHFSFVETKDQTPALEGHRLGEERGWLTGNSNAAARGEPGTRTAGVQG